MSDTKILSDKVLSHAVFAAVIDAPIEAVDLARWLLNLPDKEYQRCAPSDHKAAGYTTTDDGRPMSINVETIGAALVVQHYVAEVTERDHCHLVSLSDVLSPEGWTTGQFTWCLRAEAIDERTSKFTNTVISRPTEDFLAFIAAHGQTFEEIAATQQAASADQCARQTPRFAASIGRRANTRKIRQAQHAA